NKQPTLFTRFPGFSPDCGFRSTLFIDDTCCRDFTSANVAAISSLPGRNERITRSVDLFMEEIQYLSQNKEVAVVVCALPLGLYEAMERDEMGDEGDEDAEPPEPDSDTVQIDFHDM